MILKTTYDIGDILEFEHPIHAVKLEVCNCGYTHTVKCGAIIKAKAKVVGVTKSEGMAYDGEVERYTLELIEKHEGMYDIFFRTISELKLFKAEKINRVEWL